MDDLKKTGFKSGEKSTWKHPTRFNIGRGTWTSRKSYCWGPSRRSAIRPLPSARNWRRKPKARGMLVIFGARPARFLLSWRTPNVLRGLFHRSGTCAVRSRMAYFRAVQSRGPGLIVGLSSFRRTTGLMESSWRCSHELCGAGFAFSQSGDLRLFSGFCRSQSHVGGRRGRGAVWAFNCYGENFALSIEPINVRPALGLTIGDPEVVGTFANGLFQIWHGIFLSWCAQPRQAKSCSIRLMKS